jgi:hypothetical protein
MAIQNTDKIGEYEPETFRNWNNICYLLLAIPSTYIKTSDRRINK